VNALTFAAWLVTSALDAGSAQPITERNWRTHEEVVAIRRLVEGIEGELKAKKLRGARSEPGCINYSGDHTRELFQDGKGRARILVIEEGSGDSMVTARHYYDDAGRLRFVFIRLGAVPDGHAEKRLYFSPDGRRIWETDQHIRGHNPWGRQVWPDEKLVRDPQVRFHRVEQSCSRL
jgi:hypothetical protein